MANPSKGVGKTKNNHAKSVAQKIELRRHLLAHIPNARVFDAYAGSGKMHREVWHQATAYVGCDLKWYRDTRSAYAADNVRVMRAIDLADFNIFDLDAYGSPWVQATILSARRRLKPGERIGVALTDGSALKLKLGQCPKALAELCNLATATVPGINRVHAMLIDQGIREVARRMGGAVIEQWDHVRPGGSEMRYLSVVIQGV